MSRSILSGTINKIVIQYCYRDNPDDKYTRTFYSIKSYHTWMDSPSNSDKLILQQLYRYSYECV